MAGYFVDPIISVLILTYNHKDTIMAALSSVISQKVSVPYEILLIDDGSSDGTQDILKEFYAKHSDITRLFLGKYNNGNVTKSEYYIMNWKVRGKYIAFLEGDDYWIDDHKLIKQFEILEGNAEFSATVSDVSVIDESGNLLPDYEAYYKKDNHIFTLDDYRNLANPGRVATLLCRNPFKTKIDCSIHYTADRIMGDMTLYAILLIMGSIYQMEDKTAVYRRISKSGGTNFNSISLNNRFNKLRYIRYWIRIENFLHNETDGEFVLDFLDTQIKKAVRDYAWRDIYIAIRETWNKKRICMAFYYHFLSETNKVYDEDGNIENAIAWKKLSMNKKPIVLFGAGRMAEEFLDIYSWRMPVLFIVDNDNDKVGKSFKGYIIKKPEELTHFKDKVVVLITNKKHENEMKKQIEQYGVKDCFLYCSMQNSRAINHISQLFETRN